MYRGDKIDPKINSPILKNFGRKNGTRTYTLFLIPCYFKP